MKIPLIKYLFSQKTTTTGRTYALLSLALRVIPSDVSSDKLTVPWFYKHDTPVKEKNDGLMLPGGEEQLPRQISEDEFD